MSGLSKPETMNTFPFRTGQHIVYICLLFGFVAGTLNGAGRVKTGLQAIYDFNSTDGPVVKDRSGVQPALDLRIADLTVLVGIVPSSAKVFKAATVT